MAKFRVTLTDEERCMLRKVVFQKWRCHVYTARPKA
jgi:hypothetical protein